MGDACHLPFRNASFRQTKSSHLLEHLPDPLTAIDEIDRVTTEEVILKFPTEKDVTPYFLSSIFPFPNLKMLYLATETRRKKLHIWIINPKTILNYLKRKGWSGICTKGNFCLFTQIGSGRKAKLFEPLLRNARIDFEYIIVAKKA